jgi:hypothetical protein
MVNTQVEKPKTKKENEQSRRTGKRQKKSFPFSVIALPLSVSDTEVVKKSFLYEALQFEE